MSEFFEVEVVSAFSAVAKEVLTKVFPLNSCVASSNVAVKCFERFGIKAEAFPVKWFARSGSKGYVSGLSESEQADLRLTTNFVESKESIDTWNGHVIVATDGYFIDPSFDQAVVACGLPREDAIVAVPRSDPTIPLEDVHLTLEFAAGEDLLKVEYWPLDDRRYLESPAWKDENAGFVVDAVCSRMLEVLRL